jgi:colanic acid/amylovoran biosynthesis glycosyltransferase
MHLAVILSMKRGMENFVFRELSIISGQGAQISLFPTKFREGAYNAKPGWTTHPWNPISVLFYQLSQFLHQPSKYLSLLATAIRFHSLGDFAIAVYFASKMHNVDVIYSIFGDHKLFIGYFCKFLINRPLVVTIHAYELYRNPNPAMFSHALASCDQIITVTEYNREILSSRYGIDPGKIEVVRISVDTEEFNTIKKFIILIVAYFAERKGHEVLFNAVKQLAMDEIEIWVVGDEGVEEGTVNVRELASKVGIAGQVAFFGNLSGRALRGVYQVCDVFCLPCHFDRYGTAEGFPTVLAEAMAFGKPVITTRHVEIPRIIDEILVDENDVVGFAQAIRNVYDSKALRERLGKKNRSTAVARFSTRNAERTFQIFNDLSTA